MYECIAEIFDQPDTLLLDFQTLDLWANTNLMWKSEHDQVKLNEYYDAVPHKSL